MNADDLPAYGTVLRHPGISALIAMVLGVDDDRSTTNEGACLVLFVLSAPDRHDGWTPGTVHRGWWWHHDDRERAVVLS